MRLFDKRSMTVSLLTVDALLAGVLGIQISHATQFVVTAQLPVTAADNIKIDLPRVRPVMTSLDSYQEISERPLFWSERRLVHEAVAVGSDAVQTILPFTLLGVVSGIKAKALLGKAGSKDVNRVSVGDVVEGWRVESVKPHGVVLVSGNVRRELQVTPGLGQSR